MTATIIRPTLPYVITDSAHERWMDLLASQEEPFDFEGNLVFDLVKQNQQLGVVSLQARIPQRPISYKTSDGPYYGREISPDLDQATLTLNMEGTQEVLTPSRRDCLLNTMLGVVKFNVLIPNANYIKYWFEET